MRAVWRLVAHELSTRWRSWAGLALLAGLAGGVVLAAAAGARRTDTAYPRFLQASRASDVVVSPTGTGFGGYYGALGRLPGVRVVAPAAGHHRGRLQRPGTSAGAPVPGHGGPGAHRG